jgi:aminopeptidase N
MNKIIGCFLFGAIITGFGAKAQVSGSAIDVQHYGFTVRLNDENNEIKGTADIAVKFLKNTSVFSVNLIKKRGVEGMLVSAVTSNGKSLRFVQGDDAVNIYTTGVKNSHQTYTITYQGVPADGLIISTNKYNHRTFFGDNWPNRAHNWLPCVDDPMDKASVDFMVVAPAHYQVIANGLKVSETTLPDHQKLTHWKETARLSTKIMVIGVAEFAIDHPATVNGIPVYTYVFPEDAAIGFKSYTYAAKILPFYIDKIGPYPYKKLANVQSKTIFGGMENAGAIFYYENSVNAKDIEELMAHEIAHQWFGDAASETNWGHVWLSEGFATYLTRYYLENKYGTDTLKKKLAADRLKVLKFEKVRFTPVVDTTEKKKLIVLLNANSYEKGSWALHMLRHKLGDAAFWKGIRNYFAKYNGGNANTADLRKVMEQASGQNLQQFFNQWLFTAGHPDLDIVWKYNEADHSINITVTQKQSAIYHLPLELAIDGKVQAFPINQKQTIINIPATKKPNDIVADPNVNLLASFSVSGN